MSDPITSVKRRLHGMLARGVVLMSTAATKLQELQLALLDEETSEGVEHFEPYGYTSRPHPGAEAIALHLGGDRAHCVAVVVADRRYRLQQLEQGEVGIYTDEGDSIILRRGSEIHVTTATMRHSGVIISEGDVIAGGVSLMHHTHSGVEPGGGSTGQPNGGA